MTCVGPTPDDMASTGIRTNEWIGSGDGAVSGMAESLRFPATPLGPPRHRPDVPFVARSVPASVPPSSSPRAFPARKIGEVRVAGRPEPRWQSA